MPREIVLAFKAQCEDVIPGVLRCAEDILDIPPDIRDRIEAELAIEGVLEHYGMEADDA